MDVRKAISVSRITDVGSVRERNEDAVASELSTGLVMVADGMGGYKGGAIASEISILVVSAELAELLHQQKKRRLRGNAMSVSDMLKKAVAKANQAIYSISQHSKACQGMGTTMVAGVFYDNKLLTGHIGDSRLYRFRDNALSRLTEDHSLLQEQLNAGLITPEQAKRSNDSHLVTRALGTDPEVELEVNEYPVAVGDVYLLCSDGLTDLVPDEEIAQVLINANNQLDIAAKTLVKLANKYGGNDNISVVIALVKEPFAKKHSWLDMFVK